MPPLLADFTHARPCKPFCEKILDTTGRELINDKYIAIFELVKNSYDAGASFATNKI